jgi:tRNA (guanine37-N1)-methyltransferase
MFETLNYGITGRAIKDKLLTVDLWNPRDFTHNKHNTVDDRPYGGGPGMIMMAEPLQDAIVAAKSGAKGKPVVIHLRHRVDASIRKQLPSGWRKRIFS